MPEHATTAQLPLGARTLAGIREPANWLALVRFSLVGAVGYAVNLAVFALAFHALALDYRLAATLAFLVAVSNNFALNRRWTFRDARAGHAAFQAARFLVISVAAFAFSLGMLQLLVGGLGVRALLAQAISIVAATPLSFLGNKLWSFAPSRGDRR